MSAKLSKRLRLFLDRVSGANGRRPSLAFRAFRRSLTDDGARAAPPLDVDALLRLVGNERRLAERLLIEALPDRRAILGLGELGARRAQRRLQEIYRRERDAVGCDDEDWSAYDLVAAARALWLIAPSPEYVEIVVDVLASGRSYAERMDAAEALAAMPTAETELALNAALDDRDALVRHHAARSLIALHGLETEARAFAPMLARMMAEDRDRRIEGRRELHVAIAGETYAENSAAE